MAKVAIVRLSAVAMTIPVAPSLFLCQLVWQPLEQENVNILQQ